MATLKIITNEDLANKGVMPLADVPGLSAEEMKRKFEEIVRDVVITAFNLNMQLLEDAVFVDPQSHTYYLRASDLLTTYQSILDNGDAGKIAAAVAVKEMNTEFLSYLSEIDDTIFYLSLETKYRVYVKYYANGGDGTTTQQVATKNSANKFTLRSEVDFTRTGYTFAGWALTSGGAAEYQPGEQVTIETDDDRLEGNVLKLYAVWTQDED